MPALDAVLAPRAAPLPRRWAAVVAAVSGWLGTLAFPQIGVWPLAMLSVAGLSIACSHQRARTALWLGCLYGACFFGPLLHWTSIFVGALPWLFLLLAEAVFTAALGAAVALLSRMRMAWLTVACAWVLQEALRDRLPFGGFPWGRLAFAQAQSPLRWLAALGGAPLVSFATALVGTLLGAAVVRLRSGSWRTAAVALGALVGAGAMVLVGSGALGWLLAPGPAPQTTTVAVVQGSVPDLGLDFETRARQVLDNHVTQTLKLAADIEAGRVPRPSLVVWPENASDVDPYLDSYASAEITRAVRAVGAPVLVGAILSGPGTARRNAGIMWSPTTGPGAQYLKRHPVPFAEYIPLRSIARLVSPYADNVTTMVAGHGNGLLNGAAYPVGDVICFEVAYDDLVRSWVTAGARLLVVQSNNATFGHTSETFQQLAMTRLRAIEHRRTTVLSTTTGKSAILGPDGSLIAQSGALYTPAILVSDVPLENTVTLADRLGVGPEAVLASGAVAALALGAVAQRRRSTETTEELVTR